MPAAQKKKYFKLYKKTQENHQTRQKEYSDKLLRPNVNKWKNNLNDKSHEHTVAFALDIVMPKLCLWGLVLEGTCVERGHPQSFVTLFKSNFNQPK